METHAVVDGDDDDGLDTLGGEFSSASEVLGYLARTSLLTGTAVSTI